MDLFRFEFTISACCKAEFHRRLNVLQPSQNYLTTTRTPCGSWVDVNINLHRHPDQNTLDHLQSNKRYPWRNGIKACNTSNAGQLNIFRELTQTSNSLLPHWRHFASTIASSWYTLRNTPLNATWSTRRIRETACSCLTQQAYLLVRCLPTSAEPRHSTCSENQCDRRARSDKCQP